MSEFDKIDCELPFGLLVTPEIAQDYFHAKAIEAGVATREIGGKWLKFGRLSAPLLAAAGSMIGLSLDNWGSNPDIALAAPGLQPVPTPETGTNCRVGNPEQMYPLCMRTTDHLNRQRFLGLENISLDAMGPIGGVDDWVNGNYVQTYILNRDYYGTGRPVISAIGLHPGRQLLFLGTSEEVQSGIFFNRGGELINIQQPPDKTRNVKVTAEGINFQSDSGVFIPFITEGNNYYWEYNVTRAVNPLDNGRYRIGADSAGNVTGTRWLRVIDATATPTIVVATVTPTPREIIRAGGFVMDTVPGMRWRDGSMETGYQVLRIGSAGVRPAPNGTLPANSTRYIDSQPSPTEPCYLVVAMRDVSPVGNSDPYCLLYGLRSPIISPEGFGVGFDGNIANVTFRRSSIFENYALISAGASGVNVSPIQPGVETVIDNTGGQPRAYILAGVQGRNVYLTDGIFVIPGVAR